ncbi:hypothetical protein [Nonomuraea sp. NPDC049480]|uniref:hypothetical protein n=1 Tax=Nonomuraea sp. NPDC049480 TaxID=3364353 RepID=UPI0037B9421C
MNSDDVWQQFGVTSWPAQRARLRAVVFGCLSLTVIAAGLWWSGAIIPHIRWELDDFFLHADVDENGVLSAFVHIDVENEGAASFTLTDISAEVPGLRFLPADTAKEERPAVTVAPGDLERLTRRVVITDCAAVPHEPQPIRFTYETWTGTRSAEVTWDSWRLNGPEEDLPIAWQRALAGNVCNQAVKDWS